MNAERSEIVAYIEDLRREERTFPFWKTCTSFIQCVEQLLSENSAVQSSDWHRYNVPVCEAKRLCILLRSMQVEGHEPSKHGDIVVNEDNWLPHDGVHRASILFALDMPVPAIVVRRKRTQKVKWCYENGQWMRLY